MFEYWGEKSVRLASQGAGKLRMEDWNLQKTCLLELGQKRSRKVAPVYTVWLKMSSKFV